MLSFLRSSNAFEDSNTDSYNDGQKNVTIVDVSKENDENLSTNNIGDGSYVYDLYSANVENDSDYNDMFMEHLLR